MEMIDSEAVLQIRDIFQRNKTEDFVGNEFELNTLKSIVVKLMRYVDFK